MNHEAVLHACALTLPPAMYSTLPLLANSSYLADIETKVTICTFELLLLFKFSLQSYKDFFL